MELDEVRLKDITELLPEDKTVLNQNWDSLTQEEKDYFGTVHAGENKGEGDEGFKLPFKSQAELDQYILDKVEKREEERKLQAEEEKRKAEEKPDDKLFPDGYKAKDWNEAFATAMPKLEERMLKKIEGMNQEKRNKLAKINQEFDQEFEVLASKDPNIPKKGTPEREDWEAEVTSVGSKFKLTSVTDAYTVWKVLNSNKPSSEGEPEMIRTEGRPATDLASKVGRGYGSANNPSKTSYRVGGGRKLDDLLEQRKREEGIED